MTASNRLRRIVRSDEVAVMKETWKTIAGYEGLYEVSNMGRVRSLTRLSSYRNRSGRMDERVIKGKILRPQPQRSGYLHV